MRGLHQNLENIEQLITSYQKVKVEFQQERIKETVPVINKLLSDFEVVKSEYNEWNAENAERYNIFDVLNIRHRETKTHTPFLVNLLNPKGSHGQGLLFFNLFIKSVCPEDKKHLFEKVKPINIRIKEEKSTQEGQLDIYVESFGLEQNFAIVIENKIDAPDQVLQLTRYYKHCKRIGFTDKNILLIYLTKNGKPASDYSMLITQQVELINNNVLISISYRKHIKGLLEEYLKKVKSEKVKIVVQQYLDIIKTF